MRSIAVIAAAVFLSGPVASPGPATADPNGHVLVYFTANDGIHGRELWKSDGTEAGTTMVKDVRPGRRGSDPALFAVIDGRVFFAANDGSHGLRMWISDGTEAGTRLIGGSPAPETWSGGGGAVAGGSLYFTTHVRGYLWRTDGTTAGTQPLHVSGNCLASSGGVVFFLHNGQTEVWRTDGTDSGTFMLQRLRRYPSAEFACPEFTDVNGRMFYLGRDVRHGHELWTSDGAVAGTTLVADLKPGRKSSYPWIIGRSGEQVVFRTGYPPVLWSSDGTAVDTTKLQQSPYAVHLSPIGGDPTLDGSLFFYTAPDATGSVLWKSDGTPLGTVTVKDVPPTDAYVPPMDAAPVATALLFDGDDVQHGLELWTTDGTEAGTILLRDINPGAAASAPDHMVSSGGVVFFSANDGVHGTELWRSDGTAVGTVMIKDVDPGTVASNVAYLCASPSSGTCSSLRAGG